MIYIDAASLIIGFMLAGCSLILNECYRYYLERQMNKKAIANKADEYPINYPLESMFENYCDIIQDIESCVSERMLNLVYVRVIIFESCYEDSASFTSDLMEAYLTKEKEIKLISE